MTRVWCFIAEVKTNTVIFSVRQLIIDLTATQGATEFVSSQLQSDTRCFLFRDHVSALIRNVLIWYYKKAKPKKHEHPNETNVGTVLLRKAEMFYKVQLLTVDKGQIVNGE